MRDESSAFEWIAGLAQNALGTLDLPVLARLHSEWMKDDIAAAQRWNAFLLAARETEELRMEDRHMGESLRKILAELRLPFATTLQAHRYGYAAMFALACARWTVAVPDTLQAYAWAWTENQVLAAIKLVPLGQTAGQRMLDKLIPQLTEICAAAVRLEDGDIGVCAVMQGMASARHELQYTRLFRS